MNQLTGSGTLSDLGQKLFFQFFRDFISVSGFSFDLRPGIVYLFYESTLITALLQSPFRFTGIDSINGFSVSIELSYAFLFFHPL